MDLEQQFQAAAGQVNDLPDAVAAKHMNELYGLYKQATDGDLNMGTDEVDADGAAQPSGPAGLSQAQWESWNQFKGLPEDEAKRRYVARTAEIVGSGGTAAPAGTLPIYEANDTAPNQVGTDTAGSPATGVSEGSYGIDSAANSAADNGTTARQPDHGPGISTAGGLQGDITAGAPYGGEDKLKGEQA